MNRMLLILIVILLILAIILLVINVVGKFSGEGFTTSNAAYNIGASYTTEPNYLMTTAYNKENVRDKAYFLPDRNSSRGLHPMNGLAPSNNQMNIPDANSYSGYYPSVSFPPGPINYGTKLIEGANVKIDKIVHTESEPVSIQNTHVATIEEGDSEVKEQFSANGRQLASASRQFMIPSKNREQKSIRNAFMKTPTKIGKF